MISTKHQEIWKIPKFEVGLAPPTSSNHGLLEENTSVGYNTLAVGTNSSFNHKAGTSAELTQSSS